MKVSLANKINSSKGKIALFFFQKEKFVLPGRLNNQIQTFHIEIINTKSS